MLDKIYRPADVEPKHYEKWEADGSFAAGGVSQANAVPYTIMMPPPNVTGSLHMGHALTFTLQDILIRFARMRGRDALWQPGTDHAGIATQMVVERQMAQQGLTRHDLGREAFIERVWQWKGDSGGAITSQLRRLGASPDWARERFTLDEGLSLAVRKVFVDLYRQGLIYRDKRLVNWDPKLHTAISDLEVEQRPHAGSLWYLKYPIEGARGRFITVATTRPETMLADTGIAVHPEDERYQDLVGRQVRLPLTDRLIPIIADLHSDPSKGSGAVKITPAHDFNDFEVGRRHDLAIINLFDKNAHLNDAAPAAYRGLDRFAARTQIVADLEALGLLEKIEPHAMTIPYGDRSGVVIEPWLTDQWFVDAVTLAQPAIAAVEDGRTRFLPKQWENTYFEWMRTIQPWCISRQIWWGHQVPAWYGPDGAIFVAMDEAAALAQATQHYGAPTSLTRDEDVLDTWFSSALWPFSTLGWPDETPDFKRFYPTDVLVTGFDIIFFWVARMMMMGLHFTGEVPFKDVYIHALVRDEKGQKMSKSKGNVIDPLDLIDKYGCDALRFTLTALAAQGRDIKLAGSRVEGYRNFATKLWNAARFCEMNDCLPQAGFDPTTAKLMVNRWMAGKLTEAAGKVAEAITLYRFNDAAQTLYQLVWNVFCDWYLEFAKPIFQSEDAGAKTETRAMTSWSLQQILKLLHPVMPFITAELWEQFGDRTALISASWPDLTLRDADAEAEIDWLVRVIAEIRTVRAEMNVPPSSRLNLLIKGASATSLERFDRYQSILLTLGRLESVTLGVESGGKGAVQLVVDEATLFLPLADFIDLAAERARLVKEIGKLTDEIGKLDGKLANEAFIARAPADIIEEQRDRRAEAASVRQKLEEAVQRIGD